MKKLRAVPRHIKYRNRDIYLDGDAFSDLKNKITCIMISMDLGELELAMIGLYELSAVIDHYKDHGHILSLPNSINR